MLKTWIMTGAALCAFVGAAMAQEAPPQSASIVQDLRDYPEQARRDGIEGYAVLHCDVIADGRLNCAVAAESPEGYGFGAAALRTSQAIRLRPAGEGDERSPPVAVRVNFRLSEPPPAAAPLNWIERPEGGDFARAYPMRALREGVSGRVDIQCVIQSDFRPGDCTILAEEPVGYGFGAATVRIMRKFRLREIAPNGETTVGVQVRMPITWTVQ